MNRSLQKGGGIFAVVRCVETSGGPAVVKDFSASPAFFRWTFGAYMTQREVKAYRRLQGVPGIPRLLGKTCWGLVLEHVAGTRWSAGRSPQLDRCFFEAVLEILDSVRERGVLHCDVAPNVIVAPDCQPYLVDFGSSFVIPRWFGPAGRFLTRLRQKYDRRAVLKMMRRSAPHLLSPEELEWSRKQLPLEAWVRLGERFRRWSVAWMAKCFGTGP